MCGRYRRRSDKQRIAEVFAAHAELEELYLEADEDAAPGSMQAVVAVNGEGERQIELMRWGFKLPERMLFNARSEGIESANFWKEAFGQRRCIVPADAFFEWEKAAKASRKPKYEFTVRGREPFGMAGLWSLWRNQKTGEWERTFAVVTGEANGVMQPVHDRQPVILEPRDYAEYLTEAQRPPVHLLRILPENEMKSQRAADDCEPGEQGSLFAE